MYALTLDGALGLCPKNSKDAKVNRVLDVGTGTGIWAIDFGMTALLDICYCADIISADEHPEAEVLGIDLSPIQPEL